MKVYVVATMAHPQTGDGDCFLGDILLVTEDEEHARKIKYWVLERKPLPGLDYGKLVAFNDVIYFERELGKVIVNKE